MSCNQLCFPVLRSLLSFLALCCVLSTSSAQDKPKEDVPPANLEPACRTPFELVDGAPIGFSLAVPAGSVARVVFEQTKNRVDIEWRDAHGKVHIRRSNDAGLNAVITFTVAGDESGTNLFRLTPYHPKEHSTGRVIVSALHEITERDRKRADGEEIYGEAENDRRWGAQATWTVALQI
jgi:hypothetical protein